MNDTLVPALTASSSSALARWLLPVPGGSSRCTARGANVGLEAVGSPLPLVLYTTGIVILLTGGRDDGRIDQRSGLDRHRL